MSIVRHVTANALMLAVALFAGIYLHPYSLHRVMYVTREQFDAAPDATGRLMFQTADCSFRLPVRELSVSAQIQLRNHVIGYSSTSLSDAAVVFRTTEFIRNCLRPAPRDHQTIAKYPPAAAVDCNQLILNGTSYWSLCSDYARLTNECLQALGVDSRVLWLEGHVAIEYFDREFGKWVFLDPHLNRMAFGTDNRPLSTAQLITAVENDVPPHWQPVCGPCANSWQDDQPEVTGTWFRNILLNGECHVLSGETLAAHGRWDQLRRFQSRPTVIALASPYDSSRSSFDAPLPSRYVLMLYGVLTVVFYAGRLWCSHNGPVQCDLRGSECSQDRANNRNPRIGPITAALAWYRKQGVHDPRRKIAGGVDGVTRGTTK